MTRLGISLFGLALLVVSAATGFDGNGDKSSASKPNKSVNETPKTPVTVEMEAEATSFVRQHHPELVDLLNQLKSTNQNQYQQAVRDLSRAASVLANTQKNDPNRYVLDLKAWQVNSQIQVIAARLAMTPSPELKDELKAKLREQIDLRLETQKLDRERTEARLKKLNESINKLEASRDAEAAKAFDKLTRTTPKPAAKKEKPKDASEKKSPATPK